MKKIFLLLFPFLLQSLFPQPDNDDSIYVSIDQDTITIWHTNSTRNCCSFFDINLNISDSLITMTEVDTGEYCWCECHFDFHIAFTGLNPGTYTVDVFGTDSIYPAYWGSTSFTYGNAGLISQSNSGCMGSRNDTSFIEVSISNANMTLFWDTPLINCCLEEVWDGWLNADTFHVTLTDTGPPCDCVCPFELSATFGPFSPGNYILDFQDGEYGYPEFIIGERSTLDDIVVLRQEQSECYEMSILPNNTVPNKFNLHGPYPNPFNPSSSISYDIQTTTHVSLTIYNLMGEKVISLIDEVQSPGNYRLTWNGTNTNNHSVAASIYFISLTTKEYVSTRKLVLLK